MPSATGLRDQSSCPLDSLLSQLHGRVSPVAGPDLWPHQELKSRPHGLPTHWPEPPSPFSSQQEDILVSPTPSPESGHLQYLVPRSLMLLVGHSCLMFPSAHTLT